MIHKVGKNILDSLIKDNSTEMDRFTIKAAINYRQYGLEMRCMTEVSIAVPQLKKSCRVLHMG